MAKLIIKNKYGVTPNNLLNDKDLSLRAKGLYGFLQSKPDNWKFSIGRIAIQTKEGKSAIRKAIEELEKLGLLSRKPLKDKEGKWSGYDYLLSEKPSSEKRMTGKPSSVSLDTLSKKDNSNKDIVKKTKNSNKVAGLNEIIDLFKNVNPSYEKFFRNTTQRGALERLVKKFGPGKVEEIISILPITNTKKYAPTITTPLQLEDKLGQLVAFTKQQKSESILGTTL